MSESSPSPQSPPPPSGRHGEANTARRLLVLAIALIVVGGGGLLGWEWLWRVRSGETSYTHPLPGVATRPPAPSEAKREAPPPEAPPPSRSAANPPSTPAPSRPGPAPTPSPPAAAPRDDLAARIAALEARLAQVQANPPSPPSAAPPASNSADTKAIAELQARVASLESSLKIERERAARAENAARETRQNLHQAIAAAGAIAKLRANVDTGEPFEREYDEAQRALAFDPRSEARLQPLHQWAESGIATPAELRETLESLGTDIVRAALFEGAHTWWQALVVRIKALVIARPTPDGDIPPAGTAAGDRPPAIVARAEAKLRDDDVAGAVSELSALSGAAADTADAWTAAARARIAADQAMAALEDTLRGLEQASSPPPATPPRAVQESPPTAAPDSAQ